jgi:hypothetical protein
VSTPSPSAHTPSPCPSPALRRCAQYARVHAPAVVVEGLRLGVSSQPS